MNENSKNKQKSRENTLNLGYNSVRMGSMRTTLEFYYNPGIFGNSTKLDNLFLFFNSETGEELFQYLDRFENKKMIADYLKVLRIIVKNKATLENKIAAPNGCFLKTCFNKDKACKIKQLLENRIQ